MPLPTTIYTLYEMRAAGCVHHLLVRVHQEEASNADEGEIEHVARMADEKRLALIEKYRVEMLGKECPGMHETVPIGELQGYPTGDLLDGDTAAGYVDLWIADTKYGSPWIVIGTAESEVEFWKEMEESDLLALGPVRPARALRAFFIAESGEITDRSDHR